MCRWENVKPKNLSKNVYSIEYSTVYNTNEGNTSRQYKFISIALFTMQIAANRFAENLSFYIIFNSSDYLKCPYVW